MYSYLVNSKILGAMAANVGPDHNSDVIRPRGGKYQEKAFEVQALMVVLNSKWDLKSC